MVDMVNPSPCSHPPVTPPADHDSFAKWLFPRASSTPQPHPFAQPIYAATDTNIRGQQTPSPPQSKSQTQPQSPHSPHSPLLSQPQSRAQSQPQLAPGPAPGLLPQLYDAAGNPIDPRYVAMVSRISAYYQQRCQAIAKYQQQRCQQWANMQRQKCQDMMQAAMLVVAWYIRDRISRRRRRQKHQFRRGLARKTGGRRPTKGETVRRWVFDVPSDVVSAGHAAAEKLADPEEAAFTMDREIEPDRDAQLYRVADGVIKSQVNKIDVPLMGVLSFDESESESESESENENENEEEYGLEDVDEEDMEFEEEDQEFEDEDEQTGEVGGGGDQVRTSSQEVQVSSGRNSRKRRRNSCDS